MLVGKGLELWKLFLARFAVRRPEVDDEHLAFGRLGRQRRAAREPGTRKSRRMHADQPVPIAAARRRSPRRRTTRRTRHKRERPPKSRPHVLRISETRGSVQ